MIKASFRTLSFSSLVLPLFSLRKGAAAQTCCVCVCVCVRLWLVDSCKGRPADADMLKAWRLSHKIFPTSKQFYAPPHLKILLKSQTLSDKIRTLTKSGVCCVSCEISLYIDLVLLDYAIEDPAVQQQF